MNVITIASPTVRLTLALVLLPLPAMAQDLVPKAPPQSSPVVLTNGTIHTVTGGVVLGGTVWFDNGTIRGVLPAGERPRLPQGVEPIEFDLTGKHVFPGLISAHTSLGLVEIGAVRQTVDLDEVGDLTPEAMAATAVNPDSTAIPVARSNGVLVVASFPSGGLLPGRVAALQLDGWTNADMALRADAGVVVAWPQRPSASFRSRRGRPDGDGESGRDAVADRRQRIDDAFAAARAWLDARTADASVPHDVRHSALAPALRGETLVFVLADELEQIESAVLWGVGRKLRLVIVGGRDADLCAELLRAHDVPVVLDGVHRLPRRDDAAYDEAFTLPKRLHDLSVRFCIATGQDFSNDRNLPFHAATAAAFGLDPQQALRAITHDAARILGIDDKVGSIAVGKDATLFVATGHPFELTSAVELAFVAGRRIDLRNKQTELAKKYRERYRQLRGR
jgi:imidazolonepropionase-like amidohydrolase